MQATASLKDESLPRWAINLGAVLFLVLLLPCTLLLMIASALAFFYGMPFVIEWVTFLVVSAWESLGWVAGAGVLAFIVLGYFVPVDPANYTHSITEPDFCPERAEREAREERERMLDEEKRCSDRHRAQMQAWINAGKDRIPHAG